MYLAVSRAAAPYARPNYIRPGARPLPQRGGRAPVFIIRPRLVPRGFGDLTFQQQVQTGAQIAQSGAAVTAGLLVQLGAVTGPVGAIIGAAAAGLIEVGSLIAEQFQGCGQTCVISSDDANQVGDAMLQNLRTYTAAPFDPALQAAALNNFDTAWSALTAACGNPQLGKAGVNCISDRQRGACTWKAAPGGWVSNASAPGGYAWTDWGAAGSGTTCWNYFVGFRDPIANDPRASSYVSPSTGAGLLQSLGINSTTTINGRPLSSLLLPAGLLLAAALLT